MVDPIQGYLDTLHRELGGRIPADQFRSVMDESASHLEDLAEELGSREAAVRQYGNPRRFARKIMREADPVPNPWRAAIFPFGVVGLVQIVFLALPQRVLAHWYANPSLPSPMLIAIIATWLYAYGCFRARQFLLKPMLAFSVWSLLVMTGLNSIRSVPVNFEGTPALHSQDGGLAKFQSELAITLRTLKSDRERIQLGISAFAAAKRPEDIPRSLRIESNLFISPKSILGALSMNRASGGIIGFRTSLFMQSISVPGGFVAGLPATKEVWRRDGTAALAMADDGIAAVEKDIVAAPDAYNAPWWVVLFRTMSIAMQMDLRLLFTLAQFNLIAWALAEVWRRVRPRRRRFA